jgi:hypothetical protein
MTVSYISTIVVMISNVSIVMMIVRSDICASMSMIVFSYIMSMVTVVTRISIITCTISIGIHVCVVTTADTVIHLWTVTST